MKTADRMGLPRSLLLIALIAGCGDDTGPIDEIGLGASVRGSVVLRFAAIPGERPGEKLTLQRRRFQSLAAALEERLNIAVAYLPSENPGATVDLFRNGDVHFAWLGGLTGVQARKAVPGARAIVQGVEDPESYSYFIANRKLGLEPAASFPMASSGLRFSFGSEHSTSGRLMPEHFIRNETGQAPSDFYSQVGFSGSHLKTLALVNLGTFDMGAINYAVYDTASPEEKANTLILWKTPTHRDHHIAVRPDLDELFRSGFTDDLQRVLLALPKSLCEDAFSRSGLIPASNDQFDDIEEAARGVGLVR